MKSIEEFTYYELLNVDPWASSAEIRRAYHTGLATYGPDSIAAHNVVDEEERATMCERLDVAYRTLMGLEGRARYNKSLGLIKEEVPKAPEVVPASSIPSVEGPRSFRGADLKHHREALGISLESISHETKIQVRHLEAIESENTKDLPGSFFLRGFLKAYASCLRLDPDEVLRGYLKPLPLTQPQISN